MTRRLLIIVGMRREGAAAFCSNKHVLCSGADPMRLRRILKDCDPSSYSGVVSFGLAGGLAPVCAPGDVILGEGVVHQGAFIPTSSSWLGEIAEDWRGMGRGFSCGLCAGSETVIFDPQSKSDLYAQTGAVAVDMESHVAGAFAHKNALPFMIIRAVSDPAARALPRIAATALNAQGEIDFFRVLRGVLRHPFSIPALIQAGRDSEAALARLAAHPFEALTAERS